MRRTRTLLLGSAVVAARPQGGAVIDRYQTFQGASAAAHIWLRAVYSR